MKDDAPNSTLEEKTQDIPVSQEHAETTKEGRGIFDIEERSVNKLSTVFQNPLADVPRERLLEDVEKFCKQFDLEEHVETFKKGALISQNPSRAQDLAELSEEEKAVLRREHTNKWSQPWQLYFMACKFEIVPLQCLLADGYSSNVLSCCCCARNGRNREQRSPSHLSEGVSPD